MLMKKVASRTSLVKRSMISVAVAFALIASSAQGQWTLIDDFDGLSAGATVDGSAGGPGLTTWNGGGTVPFTAEVAPGDGSNLSMRILGTEGGQALIGEFDSGSAIAAGNTGTLFYRFRTPDSTLGGTTDQVIGLTDNPTISNFNFKAGLRNTTADPAANNIDARNGGSYEQLDLLADSTWYNIWMVATNTDPGVHELYLQSDTDTNFATQTKLDTVSGDVFDFRVNGPTDIINVYFRGGSNAGGTADSNLYYDDIYVDSSAANLSNPVVPEPSGVALLLLGMGVFFTRLRR